MNIEQGRKKLQDSTIAKQFTPTLMAVVILLVEEFDGMDAGEVCNRLGVAESYKHTVRALLQVPTIMKELAV